MKNRTANSIRNSSVALIAQIFNVILAFISRTLFIKILGTDYLGVNGLYGNILSMLSLAELGVGTAIIYAMYKPLAEDNKKKICALMNLYSKAYTIIGIVVAVAGLLLVPFLDYLIKDKPNIRNLTLIYLLFLFNSVISYFFSHKRSIIIASQNGYIDTFNYLSFFTIQNILQIAILFLFQQYLLFLSVQILITFCSNISISKKANKLFPFLKQYPKEKLDQKSKINIWKNVLAMVSNKVGSVVVTGTDNLLISSFVGVYWVGLYSNYILIITTLKTLIMQMITAITASVGNLTATENKSKAYDVFQKLFFINYVITITCSIGIFNLINPLINFWIGEKYLLSNSIVALITADFFVIQMRQPAIIYINTYGLFWQIKWKSLFEAGINLAVTLLLLFHFRLGIFGVLLGTLISNLLTNVWWEPYVIFKFGFELRFLKYCLTYILYLTLGLIALVISILLCSLVPGKGFIEIIIKGIISITIPCIIMILVFYKTNEFKYVKQLISDFIKRFNKKSASKLE